MLHYSPLVACSLSKELVTLLPANSPLISLSLSYKLVTLFPSGCLEPIQGAYDIDPSSFPEAFRFSL
jgi:hypothetical protein